MLRLRRLLAGASDPLAAECLTEIEAGEVVVTLSGTALSASHAHWIYSRRWGLQRDVTRAEVAGYDCVVPALAAAEGEVTLDDVVAGSATYVVFAAVGGPLLGVLRSPYHNLSRLARLRTECETRGLTDHGARFVRGALVEAW